MIQVVLWHVVTCCDMLWPIFYWSFQPVVLFRWTWPDCCIPNKFLLYDSVHPVTKISQFWLDFLSLQPQWTSTCQSYDPKSPKQGTPEAHNPSRLTASGLLLQTQRPWGSTGRGAWSWRTCGSDSGVERQHVLTIYIHNENQVVSSKYGNLLDHH
jgi:hypothetical protein